MILSLFRLNHKACREAEKFGKSQPFKGQGSESDSEHFQAQSQSLPLGRKLWKIILKFTTGCTKKNVTHANFLYAMFQSPNLKILLHAHLYDPNLDLCKFLARSGEKNFGQKIWKSSFGISPDFRFGRRSESCIRKIWPTCV